MTSHLAAPALALALLAAHGQNSSVYTSLADNACRVERTDEEAGSSTQRCPGVRGYALAVHDDDSRMSIAVIAPGGRRDELRFWDVVTRGFSSLGPRAEWRVSGRIVRGLIVRVNANENPEQPEAVTSYLVVARPASRGRWCVTDRIAPSADANVRARAAADAALPRRCLAPLG